MKKLTVYGLPITPASRLEELAGASFCLSYATRRPSQTEAAIRLVGADQILLIDNGAFSHWCSTGETFTDELVDGFEEWALSILERCPQAVVVIPDVIQGTVEANEELRRTSLLPIERSMPVWHLDEPLERLLHLCEDYEWVAFGSTVDKPGSPAWHKRIAEAFAAIDAWELESDGAYVRPRIHMMRAQAFAHLYPFDSSDSTNVAVNFSRQEKLGRETLVGMAARVDGKIQASAGPEVEHQVKRPLLGHVEVARFNREFFEMLRAERAELEAERVNAARVPLAYYYGSKGRDEMRDYHDDDEIEFADPGGRSALRASSKRNPRNLPCPDCGAKNVLTPADRAAGYCCDRCADRNEGAYGSCSYGEY